MAIILLALVLGIDLSTLLDVGLPGPDAGPSSQSFPGPSNDPFSTRLSVMLELQADCFAGVWANRAQQARQILERGDIDEGLNAASQIGDDRMQRRAGGFVVPDSFTHGSAEQRQRWFRIGLSTGDIERCNTFEAASL